jgi:hypothetical protein
MSGLKLPAASYLLRQRFALQIRLLIYGNRAVHRTAMRTYITKMAVGKHAFQVRRYDFCDPMGGQCLNASGKLVAIL